MGDIALVPKRNVLESAHRVTAQQSCQPAQIFREDRVSLVRHRRGSFLPLGEGFLHLSHLGALQVSNLGRELLDRRAQNRQGCEKLGMPVSLDDLVGGRSGREAEPPAHVLFHIRWKVSERPDRYGDFAHRHRFLGSQQARLVALKLVVPDCQFVSEGDRLRMHAMAAPDHQRPFVLERAISNRLHHPIDTLEQQIGGIPKRRSNAVSSTSEDVIPTWSQRAAGPIRSSRKVRNAITSCFVVRSISSIRATSCSVKSPAFSRHWASASSVARPNFTIASSANSSISRQRRSRASGDQSDAISGREYRLIIHSSRLSQIRRYPARYSTTPLLLSAGLGKSGQPPAAQSGLRDELSPEQSRGLRESPVPRPGNRHRSYPAS